MEVHEFVQVLLIILITARVFAELATRLKAPSVIGELVAGVVLGPSLMGWIEPYEAIKLLAEIGIIRNRPANAPFLMMLVQRRPMAGVRRCG